MLFYGMNVIEKFLIGMKKENEISSKMNHNFHPICGSYMEIQ